MRWSHKYWGNHSMYACMPIATGQSLSCATSQYKAGGGSPNMLLASWALAHGKSWTAIVQKRFQHSQTPGPNHSNFGVTNFVFMLSSDPLRSSYLRRSVSMAAISTFEWVSFASVPRLKCSVRQRAPAESLNFENAFGIERIESKFC